MFYSRRFIVLFFTCRSLIHLKLGFEHGIRGKSQPPHFPYSCEVDVASLTDETVLPPLRCGGPFAINQATSTGLGGVIKFVVPVIEIFVCPY